MINLGEYQELIIKRFTSVGAFPNVEDSEEDSKEEDVLLPKAQIPKDAKIGDAIEVFIYKDSKDRTIATVKKPKIAIGELAHLTVVSKSKIGSFLDWGLEKDLFLPFSETVGSVVVGKSYLVGAYVDKSNRICGTMKVKDLLIKDSPYKENEWVEGTVYSINRDIGAFVAVEDKYDGLIPNRELYGAHEVGETIEVRVNKVLEDGKLDLSLRDRAHLQMDEDAKIILDKLSENKGTLNLNDHSSPEQIKKVLNMSKSGFKRAIGKLYKEEIIEITNKGIKFRD